MGISVLVYWPFARPFWQRTYGEGWSQISGPPVPVPHDIAHRFLTRSSMTLDLDFSKDECPDVSRQVCNIDRSRLHDISDPVQEALYHGNSRR